GPEHGERLGGSTLFRGFGRGVGAAAGAREPAGGRARADPLAGGVVGAVAVDDTVEIVVEPIETGDILPAQSAHLDAVVAWIVVEQVPFARSPAVLVGVETLIDEVVTIVVHEVTHLRRSRVDAGIAVVAIIDASGKTVPVRVHLIDGAVAVVVHR